MPIQSFSAQEELDLLKCEIKTFNSDFKLMKNPAWLSSEENKQIKRHASIIIAIKNAKMIELAMQNKLCITDLWLKTDKYIDSTWQTQCQNCQK